MTESKTALQPRLATFFVVYPDPLALPEDGSHVVHFPERLEGLDELTDIALHYIGDEPYIHLDRRLAGDPFVSMRFHSGHRPHSRVTEHTRDLFSVVSRVASSLAPDDLATDELAAEDDPWAAYTVLELVTPVAIRRTDEWHLVEPGHEIMGEVLTHCLEALSQLVTAYRLSERLSLPLPSRERLGPLIVGSTRPADPSAGGWDDDGHVVVNAFSAVGQRGKPDPLQEGAGNRIGDFLAHRQVNSPATAILELRTDAEVQLTQNGDYRSAVLLFHASSEVMLDAVLASLLWEEGQSVAEAAKYFSSSLASRVRNSYHNRLGGKWSTKIGTVQRWHQDLVLPRHQVAHGGVGLSRDDADLAGDAARELQTFVLDRLAASLARYPQSAALHVTQAGFERRNLWTRRAREAVEAFDFEGLRSFLVWRESLLQLRANG